MQDATDYCVSQVRNNHRDLFLCALFTPQEKRADVMTLLAWYTEISRISILVSEEMLGHVRLAWWREAIEEIYAGGNSRSHPVLEPLSDVIRKYSLPAVDFYAILEMRAYELQAMPFMTIGEVEVYAEKTSGTLFLLWGKIAGCSFSKSSALAWGLVELLNHAHGAAHRGRSLLPGVSAEDVLRHAANAQKAFKDVTMHAKAHLDEVTPLFRHDYITRDYLRRLHRCNYDLAQHQPEAGRAIRAFRVWLSV